MHIYDWFDNGHIVSLTSVIGEEAGFPRWSLPAEECRPLARPAALSDHLTTDALTAVLDEASQQIVIQFQIRYRT